MTEPTEAEVEAATEVVKKLFNEWLDVGKPFRFSEVARAALTAAAHVRERDGFDYIVNCAKPNCDGVHGVEKLVDAPHGVRARDCSCHMALIAEPDLGP